jgi:uncharacterized protein (UPF0297 family)
MNEQINSDKVRQRVKQDGKEAVREAINTVTKKLTDRGFDPAQVKPLVKEGAKEAIAE